MGLLVHVFLVDVAKRLNENVTTLQDERGLLVSSDGLQKRTHQLQNSALSSVLLQKPSQN